MSNFMDGYIDVATRLKMAFEKYPDLRIQETHREVVEMPDKSCFIRCTVTIWRSADDPIPVVGSACELYPGRTSFQRYSESEVGFTSAVGRSLAYMGFSGNKSLASLDEVNSAKGRQQTHVASVVPIREDLEQPFGDTTNTKAYATPKQRGLIRALSFEKKIGTADLMAYVNKVLKNEYSSIEAITKDEASAVIESLQDDN